MPLPSSPNDPWPPKPWQPFQRDMTEADAWYSGDETRLIDFYGGPEAQQPNSQGRIANVFAKFWARRIFDEHTSRQRIHVPSSAQIAATSADLLFGEGIRITVPSDNEGTPEGDAKAATDRLVQLAEDNGLEATLLEGADIAAGIGSVYLRPMWAPKVADFPILDVVHGDRAVPTFRWGRLWDVTFWREIMTDDKGKIWRHLELHERGRIVHRLYVGTKDQVGQAMPLSMRPETAGIEADESGTVMLPDELRDELDVSVVPNRLPNRKRRGLPIGQADTAGAEDIMDALDEAYTSWQRDIRLGKARVIVPEEFLDRKGRGKGASFDVDQEIFSPLEIDPMSAQKAGIELVQPEIRNEEHQATVVEHLERLVTAAGYSPSTFGLIGDMATTQTATEISARERGTAQTIARKQRYWRPAIQHALRVMLILDRDVFNRSTPVVTPLVIWPEAEQDARKVAETAELFNRAQAMSTEAKVRLAQPDLEGDALDEEVARIQAEQGLSVSDPTGGPDPPPGDGNGGDGE